MLSHVLLLTGTVFWKSNHKIHVLLLPSHLYMACVNIKIIANFFQHLNGKGRELRGTDEFTYVITVINYWMLQRHFPHNCSICAIYRFLVTTTHYIWQAPLSCQSTKKACYLLGSQKRSTCKQTISLTVPGCDHSPCNRVRIRFSSRGFTKIEFLC